MISIRFHHVALALLAGTVIAGPASAWNMGPVSVPRPPSVSVPNTGGNVRSAIDNARRVITPEEAKERQKNWVDDKMQKIKEGKIKIKNRDNYTDEQIEAKLNKLAHKAIENKYDVQEPEVEKVSV